MKERRYKMANRSEKLAYLSFFFSSLSFSSFPKSLWDTKPELLLLLPLLAAAHWSLFFGWLWTWTGGWISNVKSLSLIRSHKGLILCHWDIAKLWKLMLVGRQILLPHLQYAVITGTQTIHLICHRTREKKIDIRKTILCEFQDNTANSMVVIVSILIASGMRRTDGSCRTDHMLLKGPATLRYCWAGYNYEKSGMLSLRTVCTWYRRGTGECRAPTHAVLGSVSTSHGPQRPPSLRAGKLLSASGISICAAELEIHHLKDFFCSWHYTSIHQVAQCYEIYTEIVAGEVEWDTSNMKNVLSSSLVMRYAVHMSTLDPEGRHKPSHNTT